MPIVLSQRLIRTRKTEFEHEHEHEHEHEREHEHEKPKKRAFWKDKSATSKGVSRSPEFARTAASACGSNCPLGERLWNLTPLAEKVGSNAGNETIFYFFVRCMYQMGNQAPLTISGLQLIADRRPNRILPPRD